MPQVEKKESSPAALELDSFDLRGAATPVPLPAVPPLLLLLLLLRCRDAFELALPDDADPRPDTDLLDALSFDCFARRTDACSLSTSDASLWSEAGRAAFPALSGSTPIARSIDASKSLQTFHNDMFPPPPDSQSH
jgi:hypothetical protein